MRRWLEQTEIGAQGISKSQMARSSLVLRSILSASRTLAAAKTLMPKLSITLLAMLSVPSSATSSNAEKTFHGEKCRLRLEVISRAKLPELIKIPELALQNFRGQL